MTDEQINARFDTLQSQLDKVLQEREASSSTSNQGQQSSSTNNHGQQRTERSHARPEEATSGGGRVQGTLSQSDVEQLMSILTKLLCSETSQSKASSSSPTSLDQLKKMLCPDQSPSKPPGMVCLTMDDAKTLLCPNGTQSKSTTSSTASLQPCLDEIKKLLGSGSSQSTGASSSPSLGQLWFNAWLNFWFPMSRCLKPF